MSIEAQQPRHVRVVLPNSIGSEKSSGEQGEGIINQIFNPDTGKVSITEVGDRLFITAEVGEEKLEELGIKALQETAFAYLLQGLDIPLIEYRLGPLSFTSLPREVPSEKRDEIRKAAQDYIEATTVLQEHPNLSKEARRVRIKEAAEAKRYLDQYLPEVTIKRPPAKVGEESKEEKIYRFTITLDREDPIKKLAKELLQRQRRNERARKDDPTKDLPDAESVLGALPFPPFIAGLVGKNSKRMVDAILAFIIFTGLLLTGCSKKKETPEPPPPVTTTAPGFTPPLKATTGHVPSSSTLTPTATPRATETLTPSPTPTKTPTPTKEVTPTEIATEAPTTIAEVKKPPKPELYQKPVVRLVRNKEGKLVLSPPEKATKVIWSNEFNAWIATNSKDEPLLLWNPKTPQFRLIHTATMEPQRYGMWWEIEEIHEKGEDSSLFTFVILHDTLPLKKYEFMLGNRGNAYIVKGMHFARQGEGKTEVITNERAVQILKSKMNGMMGLHPRTGAEAVSDGLVWVLTKILQKQGLQITAQEVKKQIAEDQLTKVQIKQKDGSTAIWGLTKPVILSYYDWDSPERPVPTWIDVPSGGIGQGYRVRNDGTLEIGIYLGPGDIKPPNGYPGPVTGEYERTGRILVTLTEMVESNTGEKLTHQITPLDLIIFRFNPNSQTTTTAIVAR